MFYPGHVGAYDTGEIVDHTTARKETIMDIFEELEEKREQGGETAPDGQGNTDPQESGEAGAQEETNAPVAETQDEAGEPEATEKQEPESGPGAKLKALEDRIAQAERDAAGFKNDLIKTRARAQEAEGRIKTFAEIFAASRAAKAEGDDKPSDAKSTETPDRIEVPVEFDADGNPRGYITRDVIKRYIDDELKPIRSTLTESRQETEARNKRSEYERITSETVGEDPATKEVHGKLAKTWLDLHKTVGEYVQVNGMKPFNNYDERIAVVMELPVVQEFKASHPEVNVDLMIETFTAETLTGYQRKLKQLLENGIKGSPKPAPEKEKGLPETLKKLGSKPSNLGQLPSRGAAKPITLKEIAEGDPDTLLERLRDLSDEDVRRMERAIAGR